MAYGHNISGTNHVRNQKMAVKEKTHEEQIREAVEAGRVYMSDTDKIDIYEDIARDFLKKIFDINYDECFISDESALSDFAGCNIPEDFVIEKGNLKECYAAGREHTLQKINENYGLEVDPYDYLITVFEKIRLQRTKLLN
jgi:hypothetical protein